MVMEVLSKMLDSGAEQGKFQAHPLCISPRLTHLSFADDLLVFSDGSMQSLSGITQILHLFRSYSGLDMNAAKSELFLAGYSDSDAEIISDIFGIRQGVFPTRYLGLPLNPARLSMSSLQPFIEQITSKLHSWTVKYLSYAGKIRLIVSVIYGKVNFWSQVFVLPKAFYKKIDCLCSAFLWKNATSSAKGARVAWTDICKTKKEGGLGIRSLEAFADVFRLKQVWHLFTRSGSLWVAWLKNNVFGRKSYWMMEISSRLSWNVRKMLEIKSSFKTMIRCQVRDGVKASFWFDSWTIFGPLIEYFGESGPRELRIRKDARVVEATRDGHWHLPGARSVQAEQLQIYLSSVTPPDSSRGSDYYMWRQVSGSFTTKFSSSGTWAQIRVAFPLVPWHKIVWFKESVPRYSFIHWLAMQQRLTTRDRLRQWGMNVPAACVLCTSGLDTHSHLFFECEFSRAIWVSLAARVTQNPPTSLALATTWIMNARSSPAHYARTILKLLLQSSIYMIWKERNRRIFSEEALTTTATKILVDRNMRSRLVSLTPEDPQVNVSLLGFYFGCISHPL